MNCGNEERNFFLKYFQVLTTSTFLPVHLIHSTRCVRLPGVTCMALSSCFSAALPVQLQLAWYTAGLVQAATDH